MKIKYFLFFNVEKDRENPPEKQHSRGPKPVTESGVRNSSFFDEYEENGESESFFIGDHTAEQTESKTEYIHISIPERTFKWKWELKRENCELKPIVHLRERQLESSGALCIEEAKGLATERGRQREGE